MIGRGIFCLVIFMFLAAASVEVEGKGVAPGQGAAGVHSCGKIDTGGGPGVSHGGPSRCGGGGRRWRVSKPEQESFCGGRRRRIVKVRAHGKKFHRSQQQRRKKEVTTGKVLVDEDSTGKVITKKVGSSAILKHYIERMGVVSIIDRMVPPHRNRHISHGEAVAGLMVYLLNNGRALYEMENWAEKTAILSSLFPGYRPGDWTDDRIADTLDELHTEGPEQIQGAISANIVGGFGIKLDEIHYDTTSVSLWGTYDSATGQPAVLITFGYNKDHRPDLKQVVVGTAVSGDGGVPLISKTHDGNTSDSVLPISYWERLRKLAGKDPFCFIGDCKIASKETLAELCSSEGGLFLAPMAMTPAEQAVLIKKMKEGKLNLKPVESVELKAEEKELRPIYERLSDREGNRHKKEKKEKEEQGVDSYKVYEDQWVIKDKVDKPHKVRKLVIWSEQLARLHAKVRDRRLEKAQEQLQALRDKLNKRTLINHEAIEDAKNKVLNSCKVNGLMDASIEEKRESVRKKIGRGRPGPHSQYVTEENLRYDLLMYRHQEAIEDEARLDGIFLMVSNHDRQQWPASRLLALYKRQYKVERIFHVMKGPLAVSPMLLEKPERICSMMFIMTLTLQLYTLIQRQVAQELLHRDSPLAGLMPNRIKTWRPQTDKLLAAFDNIYLVRISGHETSSSSITSLNSLQLEILQLLGVPVKKYSLNAFNMKS
jgi:transposase